MLPGILLLLFSFAACHDTGESSARIEEGGWRSVQIDDVRLAWLEMEDTYRFTVSAPATGWVGVGFGGGPAMNEAAIVIGYVDDEGNVGIRDDHGTAPTSHAPDTGLGGTDDISEPRVDQKEGVTEMSFVLPREPQDDLDPVLEPGLTLRVIVAYGEEDNYTGMHSAAHTSEITL
jgi:hypothetical protein